MNKQKESMPKIIKKYYNAEVKKSKSETIAISKTREEIIKCYDDIDELDILIESYLELRNKKIVTKILRFDIFLILFTVILSYTIPKLFDVLNVNPFKLDEKWGYALIAVIIVSLIIITISAVIIYSFSKHIFSKKYIYAYDEFIIPYEMNYLRERLVSAGINPDDDSNNVM